MLKVLCHGMTDKGRKRESNQDQFLIASLRKLMTIDFTSIPADEQMKFLSNLDGHLLLVADGMGGHAGGQVASQVAIDATSEYVLNTIPWFYRLSKTSDEDFRDELKAALEHAHTKILSAQQKSPEYRTMATTLTMAYFASRWMYVVHAGDSRCYVIRDEKIHLLTRDHSIAQLLVEKGEMDELTASTSPLSHRLYNSIGGHPGNPLSPEVSKCELLPGDVVLLCTDGLTRHVPDETILKVVCGKGTLEEKNTTLIKMANEDGGSDNITVVQAVLTADVDKSVNSTMAHDTVDLSGEVA